MTAAELRKLLAEVPDDAEVCLYDGWTVDVHVTRLVGAVGAVVNLSTGLGQTNLDRAPLRSAEPAVVLIPADPQRRVRPQAGPWAHAQALKARG